MADTALLIHQRYMVSGKSFELPIDVPNPAPAAFPARGIADREVPGADLVVIFLALHFVRKILPGGVYLAKYNVADLNVVNLPYRMELADVAAYDDRLKQPP